MNSDVQCLPTRTFAFESAHWALGSVLFLCWCLLILGPPDIPGRGLDFRIFYTAASLPLSDLYELEVQKKFQAELWRDYGNFVTSPFPRPPFYAVLLRPLALLDYVPALHLWLALLIAALGASALLIRDLYGAGYGFLFCLIGFYPVSVSLRNGQDSALILLALLAGIKLQRQGRLWLAAAAWAFAFQKFNMLYLLPVVLLVHGRRKLLQRLGVFGAALAVFSISAIGHRGFDAYLSLLAGGSLDELFWTAWNLRALVWHFCWNQTGYVLVVCLTLAASIGLIRKLPFETAVWFSVAASLIVSWHSYCYDYTVALPFFYLAWTQFRAFLAAAALAGGFWSHFFFEDAVSWLIAAVILALFAELGVSLRRATVALMEVTRVEGIRASARSPL